MTSVISYKQFNEICFKVGSREREEICFTHDETTWQSTSEQVLAVTNLEAVRILSAGNTPLVLSHPYRLPNGIGLADAPKKHPPLISMSFYETVSMRMATIQEVQPIRGDTAACATVNVGALGTRRVVLLDVDEELQELDMVGKQVVVLMNLRRECFTDPDAMVLSFQDRGYRYPFTFKEGIADGQHVR